MPRLFGKITLSLIVSLILLPTTLTLVHLPNPSSKYIHPFSLSDIQLDPSSEYSVNENLNHDYLLLLDPDNLLYNFRVTAGLPAPGQSYGGWEGSSVEVRGQFLGHYLTALALAEKSTGNKLFADRASFIVTSLQECQAAHGDGYLSAFPKSHFDRLESLQPVWAPFYVIHKIMQGLLDQHQLHRRTGALDVLLSMSDYFCNWSNRVHHQYGADHWNQVLETEFGGMNDVLYKLARTILYRSDNTAHAGDPHASSASTRWISCAALFDKPSWFDPLVEGQDTNVFANLHANTHLAQVNGFAARFEATGDVYAGRAVANFFKILTQSHSFSTGGSNWYEHWGDAKSLATPLNDSNAAGNTQESCTTYNTLKIARSLFLWTGSAEIADFYERALLNGVLGIQRTKISSKNQHDHNHATDAHHMHHHHQLNAHDAQAIRVSNAIHEEYTRPENYQTVSWPDDPARTLVNHTLNHSLNHSPEPGNFIYYMPLGSWAGKGDNPQAWTHGWGDRFNTFWCCYGTAIESFSKLADSIYFWSTPSSSNSASSISSHTPYVSSLSSLHSSSNSAPILYINQLVSSTLNWKEVGVIIKQSADLYGDDSGKDDDVATATTRIEITAAVEQINTFYVYFRLPSWIDPNRNPCIAINGVDRNVKALPRAPPRSYMPYGDDADDAEMAVSISRPPNFGKGSEYIVLGPAWKNGDVIEAKLPMWIRTEDCCPGAHSSFL